MSCAICSEYSGECSYWICAQMLQTIWLALHAPQYIDSFDLTSARSDGVLVLRRFTGGGTVVVDAGTAFVSLVFNVRTQCMELHERETLTRVASVTMRTR
jgi:hypothetical protein